MGFPSSRRVFHGYWMRAVLVFILVVFGSGWGKGVGAQNSTVSPSSSRPKSVNIGALFTFNSVIGRAVKPAIAAAIDDVNSNSSILPGTKLNLIFHDTNCSGFLGTMEGNTLPLDLPVVHSGLSCCLWTQKQSILNDHRKTFDSSFRPTPVGNMILGHEYGF